MPDYDSLMRTFREDTEGPPRPVRAPAPRRRPGWTPLAAGFALAAAGLFYFQGTTPPATPLTPALLHSGALTEEVALQADGEGRAGGTRRQPRLEWESGRLGVEVTPDRGVALTVHTEEATVEVIGTGFEVRRDALGTAVVVRHGRVRVTCAAGGVTELTEGGRRTCVPVTAAGRLGRARALQARGEAYAAEVEAALALPDATGAVAHELRAVRLDALLAARDPGAFALAEALAAEAGPRSLDAHRAAARLAADCAQARPHLAALAEAGVLGEDEPAWRSCGPPVPPSDPQSDARP